MAHTQRILAALVLALGMTVTAAAEDKSEQGALVPPPPPKVQSGETLEPEVVIIKKDGATEERYSINGQVYAVKITPSSGPAYYLIDTDGDGSLETTQNDITRDVNVPQWILFSW